MFEAGHGNRVRERLSALAAKRAEQEVGGEFAEAGAARLGAARAGERHDALDFFQSGEAVADIVECLHLKEPHTVMASLNADGVLMIRGAGGLLNGVGEAEQFVNADASAITGEVAIFT